MVAVRVPVNEFFKAGFLGIRQRDKLKAGLTKRYAGKGLLGRNINIGNPFRRNTFQPDPFSGKHDLDLNRSMAEHSRGIISDVPKGETA